MTATLLGGLGAGQPKDQPLGENLSEVPGLKSHPSAWDFCRVGPLMTPQSPEIASGMDTR